jgi:hypothetical protein
VSLQVAILKVLASYPDGKATLAAMKDDLAILAGAGLAWSERLRRLAARVPDLDIFGQALVLRDDAGWQLTAAGREVLRSVEAPPLDAQTPAVPEPIMVVSPPAVTERPRPAGGVRGHSRRRRRAVVLFERSHGGLPRPSKGDEPSADFASFYLGHEPSSR